MDTKKSNQNVPTLFNVAVQTSLTKESTSEQIKAYFNRVFELKQSGDEFPVELELVWPLVYGRKSDAVESLKNDFIEGIDYQVLRQNPQQKLGSGGHNRVDYKLTVSCMEFFIARKVRAVFEVYRKVFHKAVENTKFSLDTITRKDLAKMLLESEEEKERIVAEKERLLLTTAEQEKQLKEAAPKVEYFDKVLESKGYLTVNMIAAELGISAIKLNKLLCDWEIQYYQTECYLLYSKYRDYEYTVHRPHPYTDSAGEIKTRQHMYWTEKGKKFIIELYASKMGKAA